MKERDINSTFRDPTADIAAARVDRTVMSAGQFSARPDLLRFAEVYEARKQRKEQRRQEMRIRRMEGGVK